MSQKKEAIKYSSTTLAAMLVIAIAIGAFMYNLLANGNDDPDVNVTNNSTVEVTTDGVNPGENFGPTHAPDPNPIPTTPPPIIPGIPEGM